MILTPEQTKDLIEQTEKLMRELGIPIRDTWTGFHGENQDDLQTNGNLNGPRLVNIEIIPDGKPHALGGPVYQVNGFTSQAHDKFSIRIPQKHVDHRHVYIHELVHFLQRTNEELGETYKELESRSYQHYQDYVNQRSEREAHFVQLNYIMRNEQHLVPDENKEEFIAMINRTTLNDPDFSIDCIEAKEWGVLI